MASGSLSNKAFAHHCWDCATGRACCTSRKQAVEKMMTAVVHAFHGSSDPRPAESRWTHLLQSFKRTLIRRLLHRIGLDCYTGSVTPEDIDDTTAANVSVDEEGAQEFWSHLNRVRRKKVKEYYESDRVMNELVIYTSVLEATDSNLLYPVLGDAIRDAEGDKSKMDVLLDKDSSRIGAFSENMLRLIDNWNSGDPTRGHWVLLDILGAPLTNQEFAKWSRGQALKMNSIMSRRYEVRFATWPYKLYALSHGRSTEEEKNAIAREALAVNNYMVDCYTIGIRRLWPTPEALTSKACRVVLESDFRAHCYGTDQVERLNSEYTTRHTARAPGKNSVNSSREHLLGQLNAIHKKHGGMDPLSMDSICNIAREEVVTCSPLALGSAGVQPAGGPAPDARGDACRPALEDAPVDAEQQL
eukprot:9038950-Pyramimonas_sp.AAC.1